MKTLWAGVTEPDLLCGHDLGSAMVSEMREGRRFEIGSGLFVGPVTRDGVLIGFGIVVAQAGDSETVIAFETHEQYLWLVEGWLLQRGIGPKEAITMHLEDADPVADVPEKWK